MFDGYGLTTANILYHLPDYPRSFNVISGRNTTYIRISRNCTNFSTSGPGVWKASFTRCGWRTLGLFALRKFQSWATNSNYTEGIAGKSKMFSAAVFPSNLAANVTRELLSRSTSTGRAHLQRMRSPSQWPHSVLASIFSGRTWMETRSLMLRAQHWKPPKRLPPEVCG